MFDVVTLKNGLQIVCETIPFVRSVAFGIWVRNGSVNETPENNGISHFIEHMLFKGTDKRTAADIAEEMDAIGGQMNAFTTKEYTCYYARVMDKHFDVALDVLSDIFFNSKFDDAEIQKEREVIYEEISMYEDSPEELVHDLLQENVWNNSLGYSILGSEQSIGSFDSQTFKKYMASNYQPQNTVLSLAGNIQLDNILPALEKQFGKDIFFHGADNQINSTYDSAFTPKFVTKNKDIEQIHICLGFPGICVSSKETYTLSVLNTLFGGGASSLLFQKIREEHAMAYSVYSYNVNYTRAGMFAIYAATSPDKAELALKLIIDEVKGLINNKPYLSKLDRTKEQLKSNIILGLESSLNRMNSIGRSKLILDRIFTPDELIAEIDAVTADRIEAMLDQVFNLRNAGLSLVGRLDDKLIKKCGEILELV